jgi:hypothetical protein
VSVGLAVGAALVVIATASWTSAALALARAHPDAPCSVNQFLTRYPGRCLVGFVIGLTGASTLQGEYGVWVYASPCSCWSPPRWSSPRCTTAGRACAPADSPATRPNQARALGRDQGGARAWLHEGLTFASAPLPGETLNRLDGIELVDIAEIATDKNVPPADVQFVDVGGDGGADSVRTGWTGVTHIWLNPLNPPCASKPLSS